MPVHPKISIHSMCVCISKAYVYVSVYVYVYICHVYMNIYRCMYRCMLMCTYMYCFVTSHNKRLDTLHVCRFFRPTIVYHDNYHFCMYTRIRLFHGMSAVLILGLGATSYGMFHVFNIMHNYPRNVPGPYASAGCLHHENLTWMIVKIRGPICL